METDTHIFRITLQKLPIEKTVIGKMRSFAQNQLYNSICEQLFSETDSPKSSWSKEEREDPYKVVEWDGSKEWCKSQMDMWENVSHNTINKVKVKIKQTRAFRMLPRRIRMKLSGSSDKTKKPIESFIAFLTFNSIMFDMDVKKRKV